MKCVYKYKVPITDEPAIQMPAGAVPLTFQVQRSEPMLWCLVDPDADLEWRQFVMRGTGQPVPEAVGVGPHPDGRVATVTHIGTIQLRGYVWHLFEPWGYT